MRSWRFSTGVNFLLLFEELIGEAWEREELWDVTRGQAGYRNRRLLLGLVGEPAEASERIKKRASKIPFGSSMMFKLLVDRGAVRLTFYLRRLKRGGQGRHIHF